MGLVSEVFNDEIIDGLCGKIAIGHVGDTQQADQAR